MIRPLSSARLLRRSLSAAPVGFATVAIVAVAAAAIATAVPRAADGVLTDELHAQLGGASADVRDLQSSVDPFPALGDPDTSDPVAASWAAIGPGLGSVRSAMPSTLRALSAPGRYVGRDEGATGGGVPASGGPEIPPRTVLKLSIEANPQLSTDAVLVSGSWPRTASADPASTIEVVIAQASASTLRWRLGEEQTLTLPDGTPRRIRLVGTVRPRDPADDYWQLDASRARTGIVPSIDSSHLFAHALVWVDAASWPAIAEQFGDASIRSWFPLDTSSVDRAHLTALDADLQTFSSGPHPIGTGARALSLRFTNGLHAVIDDYATRAVVAQSTMTVIDAGPLGAAAAVLLLAAQLLLDRRRGALRLMAARGGSPARTRGQAAVEVAAATVPGAVVGTALGAALSPGRLGASLLLPVVAAGLAPIAFAFWQASSRVRRLGRGGVALPARGLWAVDGMLLVLTVVGVTVLVQRGIDVSGAETGPDPLLVLTPLLLSAAACAAALRLAPMLLRRLQRLVRRGRGAVNVIGLANSARLGTRFLPAFATVTGVAIALFASSVLVTQQDGVRDAAVQEIGADIRISSVPLSAHDVARIGALPGVQVATEVDSVSGITIAGQSGTVSVFAVDADRLREVQAVLPSSERLFDDLGDPRDGTPVAYDGGSLSDLGSRARLSGTIRTTVSVVTPDGTAPKLISNSPWLLIDARMLPASAVGARQIDSVLVRVASGHDSATVTASIRRIVGRGAAITDAGDRVRTVSASPLVPGLQRLAVVAMTLSLLLCIVALLLTLVMNAGERETLLRRLRAIGFHDRRALGLVAWEVGPMALIGIVTGTVVGIVLAVLFVSAVDLSGFVGGETRPVLELPSTLFAAIIGAFVISAVLAAVLASALARRPASIRREAERP